MDNEKLNQQKEFLANRIKKNEKQLRKWRKNENITCWRVYDKDIPEIPVVIDCYNNAIHAAEYRTFKVEDERAREIWLNDLLKAAADTLEIPHENIFFKFRKRQKGLQQYEKFAETRRRMIVEEGGLRFIVNLTDYLDTGLFLDHRITRDMVRSIAEGRRVLNLFSYTSSFSVYAADGGADGTVSVDLSNTYLSWAEENFRLNGYYSGKQKFVKDDVFHYLKEAQKKGERFDLVVIDPPTFSNSKMSNHVLDIQKDHVRLLNDIMPLLTPDADVFFSTNFTRFKPDNNSLMYNKIENITDSTIPPDFRNKKIHYCYHLKK